MERADQTLLTTTPELEVPDDRFDAARCAVHSEQINATNKAVREMRDEFRAALHELTAANEQSRLWQATVIGQFRTAAWVFGAFQATGLVLLAGVLSWVAEQVHLMPK